MHGIDQDDKAQDSRGFLRNVLGEEIKTLRGINRKDGTRTVMMTEQGMSTRPENNDPGLRMRTCERCGVGMGTMPYSEYALRFIGRSEACPVCGMSSVGEKKQLPKYVHTVELAKQYNVSGEYLVKLIRDGEVKHYETDEQSPGMQRYFLREDEVARMFAVRGV